MKRFVTAQKEKELDYYKLQCEHCKEYMVLTTYDIAIDIIKCPCCGHLNSLETNELKKCNIFGDEENTIVNR